MMVRSILTATASVLVVLMASSMVCNAAIAADAGSMTRAESLRDKPFADAKVVAPVASGASVDIVSRNGGWYQVKAVGKTGWVRMLSVRRSAATSASSITGIANVASGRTGTGKVSTTTGVRGLDAEDLATASFDEAQTARVESYRVSRQSADAFAKQAKLTLRDVQPLLLSAPVPVQK